MSNDKVEATFHGLGVCTCQYGGAHDPSNDRCDRAILDGTTTLAFHDINPRDHTMQLVSNHFGADGAMLHCLTCDETVEGETIVDAYVRHLREANQHRMEGS